MSRDQQAKLSSDPFPFSPFHKPVANVVPSTVVRQREFSRDERFEERELGKGLTAQLVVITKEIAEHWLSLSMDRPRTIKEGSLARISSDLTLGNWKLNGETIIFDFNGRVIDGRHRLTAVVNTGLPIVSIVIRGVDPEGYVTIDTGWIRTGADTAAHMGFNDPQAVAAVTRLVWLWESGESVLSNLGISMTNLERMLKLHPDIPASARIGAAVNRALRGVSKAAAGFVHYLISRNNPEGATEFFRRVCSGEGLGSGDPILAFRNAAINRNSKGRKLDRSSEVIPMMIKTWNSLVRGEVVRCCRWNSAEKFPEVIWSEDQ